ncbi:MAG: C40 family peptidase [Actinomycetota bacterium]|nr:C40 family peptidase [Actinomycetota bacterium]
MANETLGAGRRTGGREIEALVAGDGARMTRIRVWLAGCVAMGMSAVLVTAFASGASAKAPWHNPTGHVDAAYATNARTVVVRGWAYDPDYPKNSISVDVYIDGHGTSWHTGMARPDVARAFPWVGGLTGFMFVSGALGYGTHRVCTYLINRGPGGTTGLPCQTVTIPSPVTVNQQIAAYAKTFVGRYPYSFGGRSPATGFDCSGLTYYIYRKYGRTIATNAQAQYQEFRRITPNSARPGDLVFFHDGSGYVFHVGIYEGGNMMVAAATPQDGIRFQSIWSSNVTYGTITH